MLFLVGAVSDRGVLCLVGDFDGEGTFGVGIGVEGEGYDVEHATSAVRALHRDEVTNEDIIYFHIKELHFLVT